MPRDKETGKPRGFAFVMYEDQRSTVLAVDNMNGGKVLGRTVRVSRSLYRSLTLYSRHEHAIDEGKDRTQVDHVRDYKQPGGKKGEDGVFVPPEAPSMNAMPRVSGEGVSKVSAFHSLFAS
jgi:RNA-binding motif X-linked protein 2